MQINIDEAKIQSEIQATAKTMALKKCHEIIEFCINNHFSDGRYMSPVRPGVGFLQIRDQIDNFLCSQEFTDKVDKMINHHMNLMIENKVIEACERASCKAAYTGVEKKIG